MIAFSRSLLAIVGLLGIVSAAAAQDRDTPRTFAESTPIEGRYIVLYRKRGAANPDVEAERTRRRGGSVDHVFRRAVKGFSGSLTPDALRELRNDPEVELIEQDQTVSINFTQAQATWGLDRIDQADRPLSSTYDYLATGTGVTAYVIDTGILGTHTEFTGRLLPGVTAIRDGRGTQDCNGHGTHVAGTIGGTTWGVAKQVKLVPVRVLDCKGSGSWSSVIAGIDWVTQNAARPAVANMSLGGGKSAAVNSAVAGAVAAGVTMVVAAGNSGADACSYSPASEPTAVTVGATTNLDARASYSNYGTCVDIFAPGSGITSAWHTGPSDTRTISGTSMASPHVAGAAALVLQGTPDATPAAVTTYLATTGTPGRIASVGAGSPNLLLYSLGTGAAAEPAVQTIAVAGLASTGTRLTRRKWVAAVTITVRDLETGTAVANVQATGTFAPGSSASCTTSVAGTCTVQAEYASSTDLVRYTVGSLSGAGVSYDASQNTATQVTISKP